MNTQQFKLCASKHDRIITFIKGSQLHSRPHQILFTSPGRFSYVMSDMLHSDHKYDISTTENANEIIVSAAYFTSITLLTVMHCRQEHTHPPLTGSDGHPVYQSFGAVQQVRKTQFVNTASRQSD